MLYTVAISVAALHSASQTPGQEPVVNAAFSFGNHACSLCTYFIGSGTSYRSSLVQNTHEASASVDTSLGTHENQMELLQHICGVIAICRTPWRMLVRPQSPPYSSACVFGGARCRW